MLPRDRRGRCNIAYAHVDETHAVPPSARSDGMASHVFEKVQARRGGDREPQEDRSEPFAEHNLSRLQSRFRCDEEVRRKRLRDLRDTV